MVSRERNPTELLVEGLVETFDFEHWTESLSLRSSNGKLPPE